jgi:IstB-like ATP binding protein
MDTRDKSSTTTPPASSPPRHGRFRHSTCGSQITAAMIDRLVHHAEVVALKGDSYRLKDRDLGRVPASSTED